MISQPILRRAGMCAAASLLTAFLLLASGSAADKFPTPFDTEKDKNARPQPAEEAARGFKVPPGFHVTVFAAEPEVRNPIAMAWDTRGRMWVAENFTYAERPKKFEPGLRDRVLIFEDSKGEGKPDKRTVFLDTIQHLTGLEVGRGGVWLMCPPQLLFVPDRNGDDIPDGPPEVVLEGFTIPAENYHNFANGLRWGPDGWLYGRCGASAPGRVRRPDQADDAAIPLAGGIWRYHPKSKVFEPLCHGTTNPWGHDWDENGECFFTNTVNGHLWHMIPGAHYRRGATLDPNPYVYEPMEMHADHWHWDTGKSWMDSRSIMGKDATSAKRQPSEHDRLGGGHAHCGAMIYLGGQWPEAYRGRLFTLNMHGFRANVERLERVGSGYIARHEPDTFFASDPFFRGIDLSYGPDGCAYVLDWSDTGECHEATGLHRNSGRIYRLRYGENPGLPPPNLKARTGEQLVEAMKSIPNEWYARQVMREFENRVEAGQMIDAATVKALDGLSKSTRTIDRLHSLWLARLYRKNAYDAHIEALRDSDEHVRAWAIRLHHDNYPLDTVMGESRLDEWDRKIGILSQSFDMGGQDTSGLVRLTLASTLQRMPVSARPLLAAVLLDRGEDATDPNLPFLIWYGLIPVADSHPEALVPLAADGKFPAVRIWIARRLSEWLAAREGPLNFLLSQTGNKPEAIRRDIISGMVAGLAGMRKASPPASWKTFSKEFTGPDAAVMRSKVQGLDVVFGDGRALDDVRKLVLDDKADLNLRKAALKTFIAAKPADLRAVCEKLLKTRFLNTTALQGLTQFDDPAVAKLIARTYKSFHQSERPAVIEALASRPTFAAELLNLIAAGTVPRNELTAFQVRQIRGFNRPDLTKRLSELWGEMRDSPKDKADAIAKLKGELTPARLAAGDKSRGRAIFAKSCATCHKLFGAGAEIGPDLTGAGRKDLDYLLSNIIDPSAVVSKDFQMTVLNLVDGRTLNGIVAVETDQAVTLQTDKERVVIAKGEIEKRSPSPLSLMPDAILQPFTPEQVRDLMAYLMTDGQVELPPGEK